MKNKIKIERGLQKLAEAISGIKEDDRFTEPVDQELNYELRGVIFSLKTVANDYENICCRLEGLSMSSTEDMRVRQLSLNSQTKILKKRMKEEVGRLLDKL